MSIEPLRFEWDENKNASNRKKHSISFEEAATVFYDTEALVIDDPEHSDEEDRFIILGISRKGIVFDKNDAEPCHFIFLTTIPTAVSAFYLKLMAGLADTLKKPNHREALLAADSSATLWKALVKATRTTVK